MPGVHPDVRAVEPILLPLLDSVRQCQLEVLRLGLQLDAGSTADEQVTVVLVRLHHEEFLPETEMGPSPQETLAHHDETSDVQNVIGVEVV